MLVLAISLAWQCSGLQIPGDNTGERASRDCTLPLLGMYAAVALEI